MAEVSPPKGQGDKADDNKIRLGYYIVIIGMALASAVVLIAMFRYSAASDTATAVGPLTTLIGSLTGAFFGQQIGSAGTDQARKDAMKAHEDTVKAHQDALKVAVGAEKAKELKLV